MTTRLSPIVSERPGPHRSSCSASLEGGVRLRLSNAAPVPSRLRRNATTTAGAEERCCCSGLLDYRGRLPAEDALPAAPDAP